MRNRTVISAVLGTALLLVGFVTPAAAQTPGATVGVGISFLNDGDADLTGKGFAIDVAKDVKKLGEKAQLAVVGDLSWHKFSEDDFSYNALTVMGGGRVGFDVSPKARIFGQVIFGMARFSSEDFDSESHFSYAPGFGVDVKLNEKVAFRGQVDFIQVKFEGDTSGATRFWFGVSFGVGK